MCSTFIAASSHGGGTSTSLHTAEGIIWNCRRKMGSFILNNSSSPSPTAISFAILRIASLISIPVTPSLRQSATGFTENYSTMTGSSLRDFVFRRVLKTLTHRPRISPLFRSSVCMTPAGFFMREAPLLKLAARRVSTVIRYTRQNDFSLTQNIMEGAMIQFDE